MAMPENPYEGAKPGGGISLSPEYRPTPSVTNRNFFPPNEPLEAGEMRISFPGSTPWPPTRSQSGTAIMVELGTERVRSAAVLLRSGQWQHQEHPRARRFASTDRQHLPESPACRSLCGSSVSAPVHKRRWVGSSRLRVTGPSGARPDLGTAHMTEKMREMMVWHIENFEHIPIGDGCEIDCTEFDWRDENGTCYDQGGVHSPALASFSRQGRGFGLSVGLARRGPVVRLDWRRPTR